MPESIRKCIYILHCDKALILCDHELEQNLLFPHLGYHDFNNSKYLHLKESMNSRYSVTSSMGLLWSSVVMHFNLKGGNWPHAVESLSLYNTLKLSLKFLQFTNTVAIA